MIGPLIAISAACLIAYCLGRYHGLELGLRIANKPASDWPPASDQFPVFHSVPLTEERQRHHGC